MLPKNEASTANLLNRRGIDWRRDILVGKSRSSVEQLSVKQREALSELDMTANNTLSMALRNSDIVGVLAGIKPSAIMDSDNIGTIVEGVGLVHRHIAHEQMVVARSRYLVDRLTDAFERLWGDNISPEESDDTDREIGELLGYPVTSTEYFIQRLRTIDMPIDEQLPIIISEDLSGTVLEGFHQIVLSPDNWRKEIEQYVAPLASATREFAPQTYGVFVREAQRKRIANAVRRLIGRPPCSPNFIKHIATRRV